MCVFEAALIANNVLHRALLPTPSNNSFFALQILNFCWNSISAGGVNFLPASSIPHGLAPHKGVSQKMTIADKGGRGGKSPLLKFSCGSRHLQRNQLYMMKKQPTNWHLANILVSS